MGLTLHYTLQAKLRTRAQARSVIKKLRARALEMNLEEVGPLRDFPRPAADGKRKRVPARYREFYGRLIKRRGGWLSVPPETLVGFNILPAQGSESAWIGLARYPTEIRGTKKGEIVLTKLTGWSCQSFCKTQYASNPKYGGVENFLHAHVSLVSLLDYAAELGIRVKVTDEGRYWDDRDRERLATEVASWNTMIASFGGQLKDGLGGGLAAPIFQFPNFEHLEASGRVERED
jgi:hypothetical protein